MTRQALQIGEVALQSGVSVDTVRYYERRKLIKRPGRSAGGFRLFAPEAVERIKFIKQAQELGLSLDEVKRLFSTGGANQCREARAFLLEKLAELESKMTQMRNFKKVLNRHLNECDEELKTQGDQSVCPVLITIKKVK